ncbi:response regulator [Sphingobacterium sp. ML3W]|uniref:response regulator n=1 Tax=Sphingobacterium sp. ML3W TaxID=1538644 RepID=UPI0006897421|nr:response regulator [Sphingobacterium sp. ML3W]
MDKIQLHDYDCNLLDIGLPDANGLSVLEALKPQGKQEGVIIISAKNALDDKINGLQIGANDYLTKPFHLSELTARIYSIIRHKKISNANTIKQNENLLLITKIDNSQFDNTQHFHFDNLVLQSVETLQEHMEQKRY